MLVNIWFIAAAWMGLALIASLISIRTGISVAPVEILVGVLVGNVAVGLEGGTLHIGIVGAATSSGELHHLLQSTEWTNFLALLGSGVVAMLVFQILVNVGMAISLMPVTGIPLPFISHGGSSLVSICFALGVLQSVSMRREAPAVT